MDKQVVEEMMKYAQDAGSFVKEQAPLVVQELLTRGIIVNSLWLVGLFALMIVSIILAKKAYAGFIKNWPAEDPGPFFAFLFPIAGIVVSFIVSLTSIYQLCNIYFCPRLYVLEYLGSLVK